MFDLNVQKTVDKQKQIFHDVHVKRFTSGTKEKLYLVHYAIKQGNMLPIMTLFFIISLLDHI